MVKALAKSDCLRKKGVTPTLTTKGFIIYCSNALTSATASRFDWSNALIDAVIISGLTFFSTLGGGSVAGLDGLSALKAASIAACAQFFIFLALKRGIVQPRETVT
ncbi:MAG: hypothetical protein PHC63_06250 [Candidatus Bathyarchaeota archaeon]|nr:hypothetical protein [Candidatus Bathyarchaeota archaeon]MDI9578925.1 hypothetical protein [Thermoproteota archaeon]NLD65490.1 hypothetical protein [Thermoproteota archaeon]